MFNDQMTREADAHAEGETARMIEGQTAKLPSDLFLWAGLGALGTAAIMSMAGRRHGGLQVGQFAAPLLIMGLYDKLVKVAGSDRVAAPEV
ncbi:MAG TPA: hypothetical protein VF720_01835 [Candidatus Eisenbacteria bacterium]